MLENLRENLEKTAPVDMAEEELAEAEKIQVSASVT
jgi:hypothetical protein